MSTPFSAGVYTISCTSTVTANVDFWNGSAYIGTATTVSGTVLYSLGTAATKALVYSSSAGTVVSISQTGAALAPVSGTLDTLTNSQTYNQTGLAYIVAVGAGYRV